MIYFLMSSDSRRRQMGAPIADERRGHPPAANYSLGTIKMPVLGLGGRRV
jgi:hypothetical protein